MARMKTSVITLKEITTRDYKIQITGTADLLIKTRIDTSGHDRNNPYIAASDALYWLDTKPIITDKDSFDAAMADHPELGYPMYAVERTTLDAVKSRAANTSARTMLNASFILKNADGIKADQGTGPLTVLHYDTVKPFAAPDGKRTLARVSGWSMELTLRHLEQSKLAIGKIIDAINRGGKNGIGAYAPCGYLTEPGKFGTFKAELLG